MLELQRQNARLLEEIQQLKRLQRRQAAPFSKSQNVADAFASVAQAALKNEAVCITAAFRKLLLASNANSATHFSRPPINYKSIYCIFDSFRTR